MSGSCVKLQPIRPRFSSSSIQGTQRSHGSKSSLKQAPKPSISSNVSSNSIPPSVSPPKKLFRILTLRPPRLFRCTPSRNLPIHSRPPIMRLRPKWPTRGNSSNSNNWRINNSRSSSSNSKQQQQQQMQPSGPPNQYYTPSGQYAQQYAPGR
ncbi:hypothetical protein RSOL_416030 [Rhizoctonia solani AG-3 Rhs1AP]|uniref:Uncharacterized protein n=1 Tax=Rhizoctonia solani AG-3 Rhs1AP TaxID=1086054 RepID=X8JEB7_9AGAM|nr:hypothetical protein RSOL_416030 [Rhizoctonia solani AG-3 Rhs1AP]